MLLRALLLVVACFVLPGCCTVIGAAIGSAVPRYELDPNANVGSRVRAETNDGATVEGKVESADNGSLVLVSAGKSYELPLERVRRLSGTYAETGAAVGGIIDVLCVAAAVIGIVVGVSSMHASGGPFGNGGSFGGM